MSLIICIIFKRQQQKRNHSISLTYPEMTKCDDASLIWPREEQSNLKRAIQYYKQAILILLYLKKRAILLVVDGSTFQQNQKDVAQ